MRSDSEAEERVSVSDVRPGAGQRDQLEEAQGEVRRHQAEGGGSQEGQRSSADVRLRQVCQGRKVTYTQSE